VSGREGINESREFINKMSDAWPAEAGKLWRASVSVFYFHFQPFLVRSASLLAKAFRVRSIAWLDDGVEWLVTFIPR
jgi:hypothetical protein